MSVFFRTFSDVSGTSFGAVSAPRGLAESLSRLYHQLTKIHFTFAEHSTFDEHFTSSFDEHFTSLEYIRNIYYTL